MQRSARRLLIACVLAGCGGAPTSGAPASAPAPSGSCGSTVAATPKPPPKTFDEALTRLLAADIASEDAFAPSFLGAVPIEKVRTILSSAKAAVGKFRAVEVRDGKSVAVFERGELDVSGKLDREGRFVGLLLSTPRVLDVTVPAIVAHAKALPGRVSVLVIADGREIVAIDPDRSLAIGSAFKLAILAVLKEKVAKRTIAWSDVVKFTEEDRSLPSGILHGWPSGTVFTIEALAGLMISQSDNTATDVLLRIATRGAVEAKAPSSVPFLSTREAFVLKAPKNEALLQRYRSGDIAAKRASLLEAAKLPLPAADVFSDEPLALDVEWHFPPKALCALLDATHELPAFRINPGVAVTKDWDEIAYKGGSEPGVLNLSSRVTKNGKTACVVTTWNDDARPVDPMKLVTIHRSALTLAGNALAN